MVFRIIGAMLVASCCLTGCLNPRTTRLPSLSSGRTPEEQRAEKLDLERHGPFPSRTAGPVMFTRPQGHIEPRTDVRQTKEQAILRGMKREPNVPAPFPSSGNDPYPNIVR